jgi:hypothetical protein
MTGRDPEMEITILPDGTVKSRIRGIKGRGCEKHARWLADILGGPARHEPTEEFYAQEQVIPSQRQREQARVRRKA